jgi:hypothetical protein
MTVKTITATGLTVSTSPAYTSGDAVGGLLTFSGVCAESAGRRSGLAVHVEITDLAKQDASLDLILLNANPTGTTVTDNSPLDIADADIGKIIGHLSIVTYADFNDSSAGQSAPKIVPFMLPSGTDLYGILVTRSTPTYVATTDVTAKLGIITDQ